MNIYRPVIGIDDYKAFERAVSKALPDLDVSAIGYAGIIGSMTKPDKFGHDIDMIFFPKPEARLGEMMNDVDDLLYTVDAVLRKDSKLTLSPAGRKIRQESNWAGVRAATSQHPLMVHRLIYPDKESFLSREPEGFFEYAKSEATAVLGSWDAIEHNPLRNSKAIDAHYWLEWYDLSSHCTPEGWKRDPLLCLMETESAFDYINKRLGAGVDKRALGTASHREVGKLIRQARQSIDRMAA